MLVSDLGKEQASHSEHNEHSLGEEAAYIRPCGINRQALSPLATSVSWVCFRAGRGLI